MNLGVFDTVAVCQYRLHTLMMHKPAAGQAALQGLWMAHSCSQDILSVACLFVLQINLGRS